MLRLVCLLAWCALAPGSRPAAAVRAQASPPSAPQAPEDLASLLEPIRAAHDVPALGGALMLGGELTGLGVCGTRRSDRPEPVAPSDSWHLGSCAKAMTATMCARLVERGVLRWESSVGEAFADIPMNEAWELATLEQLLSHRAGAPGSLDADGLWPELFARRGTVAEERSKLLAAVLRRPPVSTPGTAFEYSNAGYVLAALMAERASTRDYESLMRAEVFEPLGMHSPGIGAPGLPADLAAPAPVLHLYGHRAHAPGLVPVPPGPQADNPPCMAPAGTWHATLADWALFVADHALGERSEPGTGERSQTPLLSKSSYAKLHTPAREDGDYALGWAVTSRDWSAGPILTHAGSNTMWFCVTWVAPAEGLSVVVTCNAAGQQAQRACDEAASALIQRGIEALNSKTGK